MWLIILLIGTFLASGDCKGIIKVWNVSISNSDFASDEPVKLRVVNIITAHTTAVYSIEFIDEETIASSSGDNAVRVWSLTNKSLIHTLVTDSSPINRIVSVDVNKLSLREDREEAREDTPLHYIMGGNLHGSIYTWNANSSSLISLQNYSKVEITCIAASTSSSFMVYGSVDHILRINLWSSETNKYELICEKDMGDPIVCVDVNSSNLLMVATLTKGVVLFDAK